MTKFLAKNKFWIFLSLIFVILRLPSLFEPYWYGDEGIYLTIGQAIKKGLVLYSQIHDNKPPTLYYLAAISQTVFSFRLLLSLVMIPTIFFFYKLSLKFYPVNISKINTFIFTILTSLPFLEGNIANAEIFMLLPTIVGVFIFLSAKKPIDYLLPGFLLGFAFTIKVPVFIEFAFLFLWIIVANFSQIKNNFWNIFLKLFLFGIGFILPIIIWGIYFTVLKTLPQFLHSALLQNFSYLSSWATGTQVAPASSGGLVNRFLILIGFWIVLIFLRYKKIISDHLCFLLFWFSATIFGVLLSTRPYPHYLIQSIPPVSLLIIQAFRLKEFKSQIIVLLSFFAFISIIKNYKFYFYPNLPYYKSFYLSGSIQKFHQYFGNNVQSIYQISEYIKDNSSAEDRVFIWGDEPYIYALSDRLPPGRYTVAYHIVDFNGYQETIDSFKTHLPKIIVYYPMNNRKFDQLDDFINKYYLVDKTVGQVILFKTR